MMGWGCWVGFEFGAFTPARANGKSLTAWKLRDVLFLRLIVSLLVFYFTWLECQPLVENY